MAKNDFTKAQSYAKNRSLLSKIVERLLSENKVKFLTIVRNLNAKYEYSNLAQHLLTDILPQFDCESFLESIKSDEAKTPSDLKTLLESTLVYEDKHYTRVERQLRSSYFVDYIIS